MKSLEIHLHNAPVIPLIQAEDSDIALQTAIALAAGGLKVIEVLFRTDAALACLHRIASDPTYWR